MNELLTKDNTTYLKGISMSMIVIHHIYQYLVSVYGLPRMWWYDIPLQNLGYLATGVFFFLSGYGIFVSARRYASTSISHGLKRCLRLYKPVVCMFIVEVIYRMANDMPIEYLKWIELSLMCSSLWFLKVIMGLYILTSVVLFIFTKYRTRVIVTILAVVIYILIAIDSNLSPVYYNSILCFPLGMLLANGKCAPRRKYYMPIICVFPFIVGSILSIIAGSLVLRILGMVISSTAFSLLILVFAPAKLGRHFLSYVGANSLIVYIAQMFLCAYLRPNTPGAFVLCFILFLFVITISYNFAEQSLRNYKSECV